MNEDFAKAIRKKNNFILFSWLTVSSTTFKLGKRHFKEQNDYRDISIDSIQHILTRLGESHGSEFSLSFLPSNIKMHIEIYMKVREVVGEKIWLINDVRFGTVHFNYCTSNKKVLFFVSRIKARGKLQPYMILVSS
jgi:hypothetical protein